MPVNQTLTLLTWFQPFDVVQEYSNQVLIKAPPPKPNGYTKGDIAGIITNEYLTERSF